MAIWPFVFVRKSVKTDGNSWQVLLRHEQIHLKQQKELLVIGFLLLYFVFWLWWSAKLCSFKKGYRAIAFEEEAYFFEDDNDYLGKRPLWAWRYWI